MIAVGTNITQNKESLRSIIEGNGIKNLEPMADRLDGSYFGFDQDYYSRMPILVNAMAENVDTDPETETSTIIHLKNKPDMIYKTQKRSDIYSVVQRTTPRPFKFNQRSSTPRPFGKAFGTKGWVESYRNAQRMKNLQQILLYLGKTFNAKLGDINTIPTQTHIEFSGIYLDSPDKKHETSIKKINVQPRHRVDPLFTFKPESPSDVNLLADNILRFSPNVNRQVKYNIDSPSQAIRGLNEKIINHSNRLRNLKMNYSNNIDSTEMFDLSIQELFRRTTLNPYTNLPTLPQHLKKIYITTSRPMLQFKQKSSVPTTRSQFRHQKSRLLPTTVKENHLFNPTEIKEERSTEAATIIHMNVFPTKTIIKTNIPIKTENTTPMPCARKPSEQIPIINANEVEDYHAGSSGIIPVTPPMQPEIQPVTPVMPFPDTTVTIPATTWPAATDIIKFNREDARIPDQYLTTTTFEDTTKMLTTEATRRVYNESFYPDGKNSNTESRTLVIKLLNSFGTTTENVKDSSNSYNPDIEDDVITKAYVPQTNGHHRNIEHNFQKILDILRESSEKYRKNRLKTLTTARSPTYVPMYVEIKRNHTRNITNSDVNEESS